MLTAGHDASVEQLRARVAELEAALLQVDVLMENVCQHCRVDVLSLRDLVLAQVAVKAALRGHSADQA